MQPNFNDSHNTYPRVLPWIIAIGAIAVIILVVLAMTTERSALNENLPDELGGDFSLQSNHSLGNEGVISLQQFRGQVVLVYFGFLSCPEVCPASMGIYQQTLNKLTTEELEKVQPLLISIDPKRDSLKALEVFSEYYHPKIIGLTGTEKEVRQVANQYGAYFKAVPSESERLDYVFDHTSRYYVIDQQGKLIDAMRHSTTANELAARIRTLL